jgi:3-hydroxybutyryl-CoA dehydratase
MQIPNKPFEDFEIGTQEVVIRKVTEEDVNQFAKLSGDLNPLHLNEEFAAQSFFGRRVVHGMFTAAVISAAHTNLTGPGFVYIGQDLQFKGPVFIGDTITVTLSVTGIKEEKGMLLLKTVVNNQDGQLILEGSSALMELERLKRRSSSR